MNNVPFIYVDGHLDCFQLGATMNKNYYKYSFQVWLSAFISLGKYLRAEFLDHNVSAGIFL